MCIANTLIGRGGGGGGEVHLIAVTVPKESLLPLKTVDLASACALRTTIS